MKQRITAVILTLSLALLCCACASAAPKREADEIIKQMVQSYGREGTDPAPLLLELTETDPDAAAHWEEIMEYWQEVNSMPIRYDSLPEGLEGTGSLCIIVLGFQLNSDGSMQEELLGRLRTALYCANQYPDCYVLCTGGGTASGNRDATEAGEMARWLEDNGIAPRRLIVEDRSMSTVQNARFSLEILQQQYPQITQAAIVTSDYHIPWGAVLFQTAFILSDSPVRITQHAGYAAENPGFYNITNYQTSGILELAQQHK